MVDSFLVQHCLNRIALLLSTGSDCSDTDPLSDAEDRKKVRFYSLHIVFQCGILTLLKKRNHQSGVVGYKVASGSFSAIEVSDYNAKFSKALDSKRFLKSDSKPEICLKRWISKSNSV